MSIKKLFVFVLVLITGIVTVTALPCEQYTHNECDALGLGITHDDCDIWNRYVRETGCSSSVFCEQLTHDECDALGTGWTHDECDYWNGFTADLCAMSAPAPSVPSAPSMPVWSYSYYYPRYYSWFPWFFNPGCQQYTHNECDRLGFTHNECDAMNARVRASGCMSYSWYYYWYPWF